MKDPKGLLQGKSNSGRWRWWIRCWMTLSWRLIFGTQSQIRWGCRCRRWRWSIKDILIIVMRRRCFGEIGVNILIWIIVWNERSSRGRTAFILITSRRTTDTIQRKRLNQFWDWITLNKIGFFGRYVLIILVVNVIEMPGIHDHFFEGNLISISFEVVMKDNLNIIVLNIITLLMLWNENSCSRRRSWIGNRSSTRSSYLRPWSHEGRCHWQQTMCRRPWILVVIVVVSFEEEVSSLEYAIVGGPVDSICDGRVCRTSSRRACKACFHSMMSSIKSTIDGTDCRGIRISIEDGKSRRRSLVVSSRRHWRSTFSVVIDSVGTSTEQEVLESTSKAGDLHEKWESWVANDVRDIKMQRQRRSRRKKKRSQYLYSSIKHRKESCQHVLQTLDWKCVSNPSFTQECCVTREPTLERKGFALAFKDSMFRIRKEFSRQTLKSKLSHDKK